MDSSLESARDISDIVKSCLSILACWAMLSSVSFFMATSDGVIVCRCCVPWVVIVFAWMEWIVCAYVGVVLMLLLCLLLLCADCVVVFAVVLELVLFDVLSELSDDVLFAFASLDMLIVV